MTGQLEFVDAGVAVTVQDLGRFGHRDIGVPLAGAADPVLMACANALLGQAQDLAVLEVGLVGPQLRALDQPVYLAVAGNFKPVLVLADGQRTPLAAWRGICLQPGQQLVLGPCRTGVGYVAVAGGVEVNRVLGSRSTYARAALGGIDGRAPQAGDRLPVGAVPEPERQSKMPFVHQTGPLRVLPGPQDQHFTDEAWALFTSGAYRVTRDADRMGLRLQGPALAHRDGLGADIVSEAVAPGAVQVPGAGQPIVLGVDAQTIGGYTKIATVIAADLPRLAHLRPGDTVCFQRVTRAQALAARTAQQQALAAWVRQIVGLGSGGAVDERALYAHNLISGMMDAQSGDGPLS